MCTKSGLDPSLGYVGSVIVAQRVDFEAFGFNVGFHFVSLWRVFRLLGYAL